MEGGLGRGMGMDMQGLWTCKGMRGRCGGLCEAMHHSCAEESAADKVVAASSS